MPEARARLRKSSRHWLKVRDSSTTTGLATGFTEASRRFSAQADSTSRLAVTADRVRNRAAGRRRTLRMYRLPAFRERPHCSMRFDTNAPLGRLMLFESRRSDRFPDRWQKPARQELMGRRTPARSEERRVGKECRAGGSADE